MTNLTVNEITKKLFERWNESNPRGSYKNYQYTLDYHAEQKLWDLHNEVERLKFELETEKNRSLVWKESYLDQVKENVKIQVEAAK